MLRSIRNAAARAAALPLAVALLLILTEWVHAGPPELLPWERSDFLKITLRPSHGVNRPVVLLKEIATLVGGSLADRDKAGMLDITEVPSSGDEVLVTQKQVMFRLIIAGFEPHRFRVEGAAVVRVARGAAPPVPQVQHAAPITRVSATIPGDVQGTEPVTTQRPAPKRTVPTIKRRDVVNMIAIVGGLKVTARGEAMEDGCQGELISLRNVDSMRSVAGRVIDRNTVEVDLERSKP